MQKETFQQALREQSTGNRLDDFRFLTKKKEEYLDDPEAVSWIQELIVTLDDAQMAQEIQRVNEELAALDQQAQTNPASYEELEQALQKLDLPFMDTDTIWYRVFQDELSMLIFATFDKPESISLAYLPFDYPTYYKHMGSFLNGVGQYQEALPLLQKGYHYSPYDLELRIGLLDCYRGLKQEEPFDTLLQSWGHRCTSAKELGALFLCKAKNEEEHNRKDKAIGYYVLSYFYHPNSLLVKEVDRLGKDKVEEGTHAIAKEKEQYLPERQVLLYVDSYAAAQTDVAVQKILYENLYKITRLDQFKEKWTSLLK